MEEIDPAKKFSYIVKFDEYPNAQLGGNHLKVNYPTYTGMHGVEHTVSLFFNYVSKIPIFYQMVELHKMI